MSEGEFPHPDPPPQARGRGQKRARTPSPALAGEGWGGGNALTPPKADPQRHATARRLRRDTTEAERKLWALLRQDALGVRFRRQHPIPPYFADFACVPLKLVIEIDGGQHGGTADKTRDAVMAAEGWRVLRYWNNDVLANAHGVVTDIRRVVAELIAARGD